MIKPNLISSLFIDFDGVLTNNCFYLSEKGEETVKLSRSDGLAFSVLNKLKIPTYIISTETNPVVKRRAKKLKIKCYNGIENKKNFLVKFTKQNKINLKCSFFIGNDVNDLEAMKICGYALCPNDSHPIIKKIAHRVLSSNGGEGVIREFVDKILNINIIEHI